MTKKPDIPIWLRFHATTIAAAGIIGIPLLVDMEYSQYGSFWLMVWGGFWGFALGSVYQGVYSEMDIEGLKIDERVWKLTGRKKGNLDD